MLRNISSIILYNLYYVAKYRPMRHINCISKYLIHSVNIYNSIVSWNISSILISKRLKSIKISLSPEQSNTISFQQFFFFDLNGNDTKPKETLIESIFVPRYFYLCVEVYLARKVEFSQETENNGWIVRRSAVVAS